MFSRSLGISVAPSVVQDSVRRTSTARVPSRSESSQNRASPLVASRWWKAHPSGSAARMHGTQVADGTDWAMRITALAAWRSCPDSHRGALVIAELGPSLEHPATAAAARTLSAAPAPLPRLTAV